jgi:hypothetical protein
MAYLDDELEKQKMGGGGSVLAGSGGAAATTGAPSNTGSGFTNLQKYLGANQGSGGGLATAMTEQGQEGVDALNKSANEAADKWADGEINTLNRNADGAAGVYTEATNAGNWETPSNTPAYDNTDATKRTGYNALEAGYQKAKDHATNFSGDYNMQNAGLQKKFGYGSGFAGLDTFLGRQDGKETIQNWQAGVTPGNASAQAGKVNTAIAAGQGRVDAAKTGFQQGQANAKAAADAAAAAAKAQADKAAADAATRAKTDSASGAGSYGVDTTVASNGSDADQLRRQKKFESLALTRR